MYSRIYGGSNSISSCEKYPLTFRPDTRLQFAVELLSVIVDNFNLTGLESALILSQTSSFTSLPKLSALIGTTKSENHGAGKSMLFGVGGPAVATPPPNIHPKK